MQEFPIDAVITWVDGNDPVHRAKRARFAGKGELQAEDIGGDIRFTSVGEIKYCVASILKFAPFIRRIFIVTDAQTPDIQDFLKYNFPESTIPVEIVDHKVLYRGYESCLPVFNSLSIETVLWRIPDLSEHYIYFNDDCLLVAPAKPDDFFDEGRAICYADYFSAPFAALLRRLKHLVQSSPVFGFKDAMLNTANLLGKRKFPYTSHIPLALRKSSVADFYASHENLMLANMSPRFRQPSQFNPQTLFYLLGLDDGTAVMHSCKGKDLYVKPKSKPGYMQAKLDKFDKSSTALFACFNSLDDASGPDKKLALDWLSRRLDVVSH